MLSVRERRQPVGVQDTSTPHSGLRERQIWPALCGTLLLTDVAMLGAAGVLAYIGRFGAQPTSILEIGFRISREMRLHFYTKAVVLYLALTVVLLFLMGAYRRLQLFHGTAEYTAIMQATGLATLLAEFAVYLSDRHYPIARGWLLLLWLIGACLACVGRFAFRRVLHTLHRRALLVQPALVVGAGREGQMLEWHAYRARQDGVHVLGYVDERMPPGTEVAGKLQVLGGINDLPSLIAAHHVEHVLVATADLQDGDALRVLQQVLPTSADVALAPDLFRTLTTDGQLRRLAGDTLLVVGKVRITGTDALLKKLLDLGGALLLLILTLPFWLIISVAIKMTSPGPLFSRHVTLGEGGRPFHALKFRTTRGAGGVAEHPELVERRQRGLPLRAHPDLTGFGRFLSHYSLDELPQLLNVLIGQMSLVGPYKISPDQVSLYGGRHLALLTMRPGLTGLCQIYGRGELTVEERSLLDAEYVRTYSIWRDLHILLVTVPTVLHGRGAY